MLARLLKSRPSGVGAAPGIEATSSGVVGAGRVEDLPGVALLHDLPLST